MNKKKIEKEIKSKLNISNNFEKIKNKINFEQYTQKKEIVKKSFGNRWWKLAIPCCFILGIASLYFVELFPIGNMNETSTGDNKFSNNNQSQIVSNVETTPTSNAVSTDTTSIPTMSTDSNSSSNISIDETNKPTDSSLENPGLSDETGNYTELNGYFENSDLEFIGYQSYAVFDIDRVYSVNETLNIIIYLGTSLENVDSFTTSIIMHDSSIDGTEKKEPIVLKEIDNFSYANYPLNYEQDSDKNITYAYLKTSLLVTIDLSKLCYDEGMVYIGLNYLEDNTNYKNNGVLGSTFYYKKLNDRISFYK